MLNACNSIASALPWIANDFGEVAQLNWIISAFNLTSAAFIPFWGQIADIFGRHRSIQAAILIMMVGSAFCTAAPSHAFPVLLLGRGIQGLGCAGLNVVVRVILSDKVSLKDNAKNTAIFQFTAGMSYGVGPVIGGEWRALTSSFGGGGMQRTRRLTKTKAHSPIQTGDGASPSTSQSAYSPSSSSSCSLGRNSWVRSLCPA
jgi:MFS family permease